MKDDSATTKAVPIYRSDRVTVTVDGNRGLYHGRGWVKRVRAADPRSFEGEFCMYTVDGKFLAKSVDKTVDMSDVEPQFRLATHHRQLQQLIPPKYARSVLNMSRLPHVFVVFDRPPPSAQIEFVQDWFAAFNHETGMPIYANAFTDHYFEMPSERARKDLQDFYSTDKYRLPIVRI